MDHPCKRCKQTFPSAKKLAQHLTREHSGSSNRNPLIVPSLLAGGAVLVVLIVVFAQTGGPATTPEANIAALGLADDPIMGDADADVILVGFEAPGCSACRNFHLQLLPDIKRDFFDTGKAQYRFVQTTIGYDVDFPGGVAQECALSVGGSEAFWGFTDILYERQGMLHEENLGDALAAYGDSIGADGESMRSCYDAQDTRRAVSSDWDAARDAGVRGTPTFFIIPRQGAAYQVETRVVYDALADATA